MEFSRLPSTMVRVRRALASATPVSTVVGPRSAPAARRARLDFRGPARLAPHRQASARLSSTRSPAPVSSGGPEDTPADGAPTAGDPPNDAADPGTERGGPTMAIIFTCKVCETRSAKRFTKNAYENGVVVVVRCPGCQSLHLIADRLGWFEDSNDCDVHQALEQKGERVDGIDDDNLAAHLPPEKFEALVRGGGPPRDRSGGAA